MVSTDITTEIISGVFAIIGTIIGTLFGYSLTSLQVDKQKEIEKRKVATAFYAEINEIEKVIYPVITYCKQREILYDNGRLKVNFPGALNRAIISTVGLDKFNPLYDEKGLYFHFRKDIYMFDTDTVKAISKFYSSILAATNSYKIYRDEFSTLNASRSQNSSNPQAIQDEVLNNIQDEVLRSILDADKEFKNLLCLLEIQIN